MDDFTHLWLLRAQRREHLARSARNPARLAAPSDRSRPHRQRWSLPALRWPRLVRRQAA